jgi:hypothetical protein
MCGFGLWIPFGDPIANFGWKIHVSGVPSEALRIIQVVWLVLTKYGVAYKVPTSLPKMRDFYNSSRAKLNMRLNQFDFQRGKMITIYPENDDQANAIVNAINDAFVREGLLGAKYFIPCLGEIQVGETGGIFTRWCRDYRADWKDQLGRLVPYIDTRHTGTHDYMRFDRKHPFDLKLYYMGDELGKQITEWRFNDLNTFISKGMI